MLFSGEIYTTGKKITLLPAVTNITSAGGHGGGFICPIGTTGDLQDPMGSRGLSWESKGVEGGLQGVRGGQ